MRSQSVAFEEVGDVVELFEEGESSEMQDMGSEFSELIAMEDLNAWQEV